MCELIDLKLDFDKGNRFSIDVAKCLADMLDDSYRVVVKYDLGPLDIPNDDKKNIIFSLSREVHLPPEDLHDPRVHYVFHNYAELDMWGHPVESPKVFPMPIGTFLDDDESINIKTILEREYDFVFIGQIPHTGTRDKFKKCLDKFLESSGHSFKYKVVYTDGFARGLKGKEYLELLSNSKLCLCPTGATSEETFRFFEALKMGCFPVLERLPKFWYYLNAPFFTGRWEFLDHTINQTLNFLHNPKNKAVFMSLARYNMTVLDPKHLSLILKSKIDEFNTAKLQDSL